MIIGNGQLAKAFRFFPAEDVVIFASGVSNSNCIDPEQFDRERDLLIKTLEEYQGKVFVYFSSCALSVADYSKSEYYKHKKNMENIIKEYSNSYYIFRIPQLFGDLISHKTLINYIFESITLGREFDIYDDAYRYVIEINDVYKLVESYLINHQANTVVDLANPYRYRVLDIVLILEKLLDKKAKCNLINKTDKYNLDLSSVLEFVKRYRVDIDFGKDYLESKLVEKFNYNGKT